MRLRFIRRNTWSTNAITNLEVLKMPRMSSNSVYVFEGAIDLLSFLTLEKLKGNNQIHKSHFLSLCGTSNVALKRYLKDYPQIKRIHLCLDNDLAERN